MSKTTGSKSSRELRAILVPGGGFHGWRQEAQFLPGPRIDQVRGTLHAIHGDGAVPRGRGDQGRSSQPARSVPAHRDRRGHGETDQHRHERQNQHDHAAPNDGNDAVLATCLLGMIKEPLYQQILGNREPDLEDLVNEIFEVAARGILAVGRGSA